MGEWIQAKFILRFHSSFFRSKKFKERDKMTDKNNEIVNEIEKNGNRVSNSRLSSYACRNFEISFDRISLVGDLIESEELAFSSFISNSVYFNIFDLHTSQVKGQSVDNVVYFEYDKFKGKAHERRNMRVEFNPSNLDQNLRKIIRNEFVSRMKNTGFSRLDLAFDCFENIKDYYVLSDAALKKTIIYGRNGEPETKYFGSRDSDRYIRIYNKKQEIKDNKDLEIEAENYWRIEFELKRERTERWATCFEDLNFLKPDYKTIDDFNLRSKVFYLLNDESAWGELHRNTKTKYRKILKEISPVNLKNDMQENLNLQREKLQEELNFWLA